MIRHLKADTEPGPGSGDGSPAAKAEYDRAEFAALKALRHPKPELKPVVFDAVAACLKACPDTEASDLDAACLKSCPDTEPLSRYNPRFAVRILILSDVHSNLEALDACLAAAPAHDMVVNLGDTVGYGANPNEVVARVRVLGNTFVRGNHDKAVSGLMDLEDFNPIAGIATLWTRDQLTAENLAWLRELPQGPVAIPELPGVQFVHGSAHDEDEYVVSIRDALEPLLTDSIPVTFFGHTHLQGGFALQGEISEAYRPAYRTVGQAESSDWPLKSNRHYLINPGSVGQPRDGDWRAGFAMFDTDGAVVTFYRVPYNLRVAQEKINAANLPPRLAARLATGR